MFNLLFFIMFFVFVRLSMALSRHREHDTNSLLYSSPLLVLQVITLTVLCSLITLNPTTSSFSYMLMMSSSLPLLSLLSLASFIVDHLNFPFPTWALFPFLLGLLSLRPPHASFYLKLPLPRKFSLVLRCPSAIHVVLLWTLSLNYLPMVLLSLILLSIKALSVLSKISSSLVLILPMLFNIFAYFMHDLHEPYLLALKRILILNHT